VTTPFDISTFIYDTGTLTIAPGDTTAVLSGTPPLSYAIKPGDYLFAGGSLAVIETVSETLDDDKPLGLFSEWTGNAVTNGSYVIIKASIARYDSALAAYETNRFLTFLDDTQVFYVVAGDEPDPSIGEEGQFALKTNVTPWKLWIKTAAVWVLQPGSPGGPGDPGADGATWIAQASEPDTDYPVGSLWLDSDSADLDVYQLGGSPLAWEDTGVNLKGAHGPTGAGVPAGGTAGQVLARDSGTGTEWIDPPEGDVTTSDIRERLTANRTYYVDATNGDDTNNGLASGSGHALKKITTALAIIASTLDLAGFKVTVQVADGTYTDPIVLPNVVGFAKAGDLVIQGNNTTPANVVISTTGSDAFHADGISSVWDLLDLKITTTTAGYGIYAGAGAKVRFGNLNFGSCTYAHMLAFGPGSTITGLSNYAVSGGGTAHFQAYYGSQIVTASLTVAISNTPAFSISWADLEVSSTSQVHNMTFTGTGATGKRYTVTNGAVLFTNGAATTYLPGNAAGTGTNFATAPYGLLA
jgi:hypothetical protein